MKLSTYPGCDVLAGPQTNCLKSDTSFKYIGILNIKTIISL